MTKGPLIIVALAHSANPPASPAREMTPVELYNAQDLWVRTRGRHQGRNEQDLLVRKQAKTQLRRIRAELKRRGLSEIRGSNE